MAEGAGEAIEEEAASAIRFRQADAEHVVHQFVTDQAAGQHRSFRFKAEGSASGNFGAEEISGGDGGDFEPIRNKPGLRSLPAPGRTKEEYDQFIA